METPEPNRSQEPGDAETGSLKGGDTVMSSLRERFVEPARFWEPRRIVYNLILAAVVVVWVVKTWPHFRPAMTLEALGIMTVLALLANVCYCAAYIAEIPLLGSAMSATRNRGRWAVWVIGTLFAILFENYWIADEIYPFVR